MNHTLAHVALVVPDYDAAIRFYVDVVGFSLTADIDPAQQGKRWVLVQPSGGGASIVLARATNFDQHSAIGNQTGGRVFLFLDTDDLDRDLARLREADVRIVRDPVEASYGRVAVFADPWGNLWDLIQRR